LSPKGSPLWISKQPRFDLSEAPQLNGDVEKLDSAGRPTPARQSDSIPQALDSRLKGYCPRIDSLIRARAQAGTPIGSVTYPFVHRNRDGTNVHH
jgi:hypothetical protein